RHPGRLEKRRCRTCRVHNVGSMMNTSMRPTTLYIVFLAVTGSAQTARHPKPAAPKDFAVMAWGSSPSAPDQLREMRDAGLNISGFCRPQDLPQVEAAGLTCFVRDPRLQTLDPQRLPPDTDMRALIAEIARQTATQEAALGFYLRDEPNAQMMSGL